MTGIVAVVTDLMTVSRIAVAARAIQREITYVQSIEAIEGLAAPDLALVDLDAAVDVLAAIRILSADATVVAFGPHTDTERRKAAREAGASRVLARSKFVSDLPVILASVPASP